MKIFKRMRGGAVAWEHLKKWKKLCTQAAREQDLKKLNEMASEIMWLLEQKKQLLWLEQLKANSATKGDGGM